MTAISKADVTKIARLARIRVADEQCDAYAADLTKILDWVEQLQQVNTDNVPELASVVDTKLPWRKDVVSDGSQQEKVVQNAPASEYGCFVVPKVIE